MPEGPSTILGGLPVFLVVSCGYDPYNNEYWSEVDEICWRKKDGSKGKPIPDSVRDRAENYDYGFCEAIEQLFYNLEEPDDTMVSFEEKSECSIFKLM